MCYIHEEFNRLLHVLRKDSLLAHENCDCDCAFCYDGNCKQVFDSEMDLYWCMRHMLCKPSKLHSKTARNLFLPRYVSIVCGLYLGQTIHSLALSCTVAWRGAALQILLVFLSEHLPFFSAQNPDYSLNTTT